MECDMVCNMCREEGQCKGLGKGRCVVEGGWLGQRLSMCGCDIKRKKLSG